MRQDRTLLTVTTTTDLLTAVIYNYVGGFHRGQLNVSPPLNLGRLVSFDDLSKYGVPHTPIV